MGALAAQLGLQYVGYCGVNGADGDEIHHGKVSLQKKAFCRLGLQ